MPCTFCYRGLVRFLVFDITELVYSYSMVIKETCDTEVVEVLDLNMQFRTFVQHKYNFDGVVRNVCSVDIAVVDTTVLIVSLLTRWGI